MNAIGLKHGAEDAGATDSRPEMVDVLFVLTGESLPPGFEWPLFREVARHAPWILKTKGAGILPVKGPRTAEGGVMVTHRSRLVVRLPRDRVCSASALERKTLSLGRAQVTLGEGTFRKHQPSATLYSPRVTTGEGDEVRFVAAIEEELVALGVNGRVICGRRVEVELETGRAPAFPVAVHDLREAESLVLQGAGLGRGQPVGCGLLVPHKTITAAD